MSIRLHTSLLIVRAAAFVLSFTLVLDASTAPAASKDKTLVYADFGQSLIQVLAIDTAGNTSAPASVTVFF